ncbi:class I glutamine amidotransferase-like protein [Sphaerosporella brunnea]|uniref:Class I glutamine amidotransferase-like protein n=1 Tax=Sphaerosporella brunnea TaxID=1250544 RepID=A0A5J5EV34_9PEZI|nr:class I glutamine amidotransferase-like protein [Sphaerosporella brunnea]
MPAPEPNPLRILILEADHPFPGTTRKYGGYGGVFTSLLMQATVHSSLSLRVHNVVDAPPPSLAALHAEGTDGILISGSKANAFDDEPWITALVAFLREVLAEQKIRLVGVCFGHQIIARALGCAVKRGDEGWEASVTPVPLTGRGKELFGKEILNIFQMHRDIVTSLPEDAENLGATDKCAIQGMYSETRGFITVQGHPEFTPKIVDEILRARRKAGIFSEEQFEDMISRLENAHDGVLVANAFLKFVKEGVDKGAARCCST